MLTSLTDFDFAFTENSIVLKFPSQDAARRSLIQFTAIFAHWARQFQKQEVRLTYPNSRGRYYPVLATMGMDEDDRPSQPEQGSILMPGIHFQGGHIPLPVLKALITMQENPDQKWVLVRLSKDLKQQTQIAMSEACRSLVSGASLESAIGRQRNQYWLPESLEEMNRITRQEMQPNNKAGTMVKWLGTDVPTRSNWRQFTYRYWLIDDGNGGWYQMGLNLDVVQVRSPLASPVR